MAPSTKKASQPPTWVQSRLCGSDIPLGDAERLRQYAGATRFASQKTPASMITASATAAERRTLPGVTGSGRSDHWPDCPAYCPAMIRYSPPSASVGCGDIHTMVSPDVEEVTRTIETGPCRRVEGMPLPTSGCPMASQPVESVSLRENIDSSSDAGE